MNNIVSSLTSQHPNILTPQHPNTQTHRTLAILEWMIFKALSGELAGSLLIVNDQERIPEATPKIAIIIRQLSRG